MGEAKRRREMIGKVIADRIETKTGGSVPVRYGGRLREFLGALSFSKPSPVPCGECRQCCYHHCVDVDPGVESAEDLAHLSLVPHPKAQGGFALAKGEDGACIHLGPDGCTVYEHRPRACRYYDCRAFSAIGVIDTYEGGRHSPAWEFERSDLRERIYQAALRLAAQHHIETTPQWNSNSVLAAAFLGTGDTLSTAIKMIARQERLTPAQEKTMRDFFQIYLDSQPWYRAAKEVA